jgi:hypothetical protein
MNAIDTKNFERITDLVEYYRILIKRAIQQNDITQKELDYLTSFLSPGERFHIAKELCYDIRLFTDLRYSQIVPDVTKKFYICFLEVFQKYDGISREEYVYLFDNAPFSLLQYIVDNPSMPVDMLIEYGITRSQEQGFFNAFLVAHIKTAQENRSEEILSYLRSLVPGSESMSNEMVLSISGYDGKTYL